MRQLLQIPAVYASFAGFVTGNGRFLDVYVRKHIRAQSGDKILDIGCGPGSILDILPGNCAYTGFDVSRSYIDSAQKHYGRRGSFFVSGVKESCPERFPVTTLSWPRAFFITCRTISRNFCCGSPGAT